MQSITELFLEGIAHLKLCAAVDKCPVIHNRLCRCESLDSARSWSLQFTMGLSKFGGVMDVVGDQ